jgi:hypothetical protein
MAPTTPTWTDAEVELLVADCRDSTFVINTINDCPWTGWSDYGQDIIDQLPTATLRRYATSSLDQGKEAIKPKYATLEGNIDPYEINTRLSASISPSRRENMKEIYGSIDTSLHNAYTAHKLAAVLGYLTTKSSQAYKMPKSVIGQTAYDLREKEITQQNIQWAIKEAILDGRIATSGEARELVSSADTSRSQWLNDIAGTADKNNDEAKMRDVIDRLEGRPGRESTRASSFMGGIFS